MSRAHLFRPLQDAAGNLQRGATVRILRPGTTTEVANTLYTTEDGTDTFSQPLNCPTGFLSVFLDQARRVRIGVTPFGGGTEVFFDDIDAARTFQRAAEVPLDPVGGMISADLQAAIEELQQTKYGEGNAIPRPTAPEIAYQAPGGSSLTADNVYDALNQLDAGLGGGEVATTASLVAFTPAGTLSSTDVQAGLEEIDTDLTAHLDDPVDAHDASAISVVPTGDLTATDVQAALEELAAATAGAAAAPTFVVKTTDYTLTAADNIAFFHGATLTATLPSAAGIAGRQYVIKNLDPTVLTVVGSIDGDTSRTLAQYDAITVISDGTNWGVV